MLKYGGFGYMSTSSGQTVQYKSLSLHTGVVHNPVLITKTFSQKVVCHSSPPGTQNPLKPPKMLKYGGFGYMSTSSGQTVQYKSLSLHTGVVHNPVLITKPFSQKVVCHSSPPGDPKPPKTPQNAKIWGFWIYVHVFRADRAIKKSVPAHRGSSQPSVDNKDIFPKSCLPFLASRDLKPPKTPKNAKIWGFWIYVHVFRADRAIEKS